MSGKFTKLAAIIGAVAILSACDQGIGDLQSYVTQIKSQPPGRIEPIPEFQPYQNFEYASSDLRDPFRKLDFRRPDELPEDTAVAGSGIRPDTDRAREPLEDFPLDTLRMKGTVTQDGTKWALVFAPDNTVHRVIEGNYLGQNYGRITAVNDQRIELTEIVPDGLGNYIERSTAIALIE